MELQSRGIPLTSQVPLPLEYKGKQLRSTYQADLICFGQIILELKAVSGLIDEHRAQLQNYLKATNLSLGILINFGHFPGVEVERIVCQKGRFLRGNGLPPQQSTGI
jgi:GxxExxY protein